MEEAKEDIKYLKARCAKYDTDYALMCKDIADIKIDIKEIKDNQKIYMDHMEQFIEKMDEKYAGKWVEKILWGMGGVIGTAILIAILSKVIK